MQSSYSKHIQVIGRLYEDVLAAIKKASYDPICAVVIDPALVIFE